ncbi:MAG TPA: hypothetical protein VHA75_12590, partial [Rugosimonospora sp.]|nr:hypothetical protein [Rugosimonospora sp.]
MLSRIDRIDRAADGWAVDLGLYALSFGFAVLTALTATLPPHAAWGPVAASVYGVAAVVSLVAVVLPGFRLRPVLPARRRLAITVAIGTAALPLVIQAWQRAHGVAGRAQ